MATAKTPNKKKHNRISKAKEMKAPALRAIVSEALPRCRFLPDTLDAPSTLLASPMALPTSEGKQQITPAATRYPAFHFVPFRLSCFLASLRDKVRQRRSESGLFHGAKRKGQTEDEAGFTRQKTEGTRGRSRAPVDLKGKDNAIFTTLRTNHGIQKQVQGF